MLIFHIKNKSIRSRLFLIFYSNGENVSKEICSILKRIIYSPRSSTDFLLPWHRPFFFYTEDFGVFLDIPYITKYICISLKYKIRVEIWTCKYIVFQSTRRLRSTRWSDIQYLLVTFKKRTIFIVNLIISRKTN